MPKSDSWLQDNEDFDKHADIDDDHPIAGYMKKADEQLRAYEEGVSRTFKETVKKYRRKYGRHPPPGFREWYKFARERAVHNIDDFDQIMDDLRPFWGIKPDVIRAYAGTLSRDDKNGVAGLHIRNKSKWKVTGDGWRIDNFEKLVKPFVQYLPDMDVIMNRHDQPRVVVPWEEMQKLLAEEKKSRHLALGSEASWTTNMTGFYQEQAPEHIPDPKWVDAPGKQFMLIAKEACPPESPARRGSASTTEIDALFKDANGGFVTNFNKSTDLCIVGPEVEDKHGFLFASSTLSNSGLLLPIFSECKVNVNSDVLFPASVYYNHDERYTYDPKNDYNWDDKHDRMVWRGVTSGGTNTELNWHEMHRQRLVQMSNATVMSNETVLIMKQDSEKPGTYVNLEDFNATDFIIGHTDVGFTEGASCIPDKCPFYENVWTYKPQIGITEQFKNKFLIDVDGATFSGRWRAFLFSKSLGIKATIFREWHDSRLIPWRHFVPLDNRYGELYALLTYFIGLGKATESSYSGEPYVQRHDFEAKKIAAQGREWANKVLRDADIEVSCVLSYWDFSSLTPLDLHV